MQVRLTGKDDWGAVPGERVASISGREGSSVSGAMKDLLDIVVKDPDSSLNKSLSYPAYPVFDMYGGPQQRGPPGGHRLVFG